MKMKELLKLWDDLRDIPCDYDGAIEEKFMHFEVGNDREDIWHWFEEENDEFVVGDVMRGIRRD